MKLYRDFETQDELDAQYNPSLNNPPERRGDADWPKRAAAARTDPRAVLNVRFGPTRPEHLDIFKAGDRAPVHLFIHGGYWRARQAADFSFVGPALADAGITAVINNYALCPEVTLDEVVRQARAAVAWTFTHISDFGGDPQRISVSGHSAGGHLTAIAAMTDWQGAYGLPADLVKAALPISGLFDLAPFPYSYLQPALQLTWAEVRRNSPALNPVPQRPAPMIIAVGGDETAEFHRQSDQFAEHWRAGGGRAERLDVPGRDHFSVLNALLETGNPLNDALRRLAFSP